MDANTLICFTDCSQVARYFKSGKIIPSETLQTQLGDQLLQSTCVDAEPSLSPKPLMWLFDERAEELTSRVSPRFDITTFLCLFRFTGHSDNSLVLEHAVQTGRSANGAIDVPDSEAADDGFREIQIEPGSLRPGLIVEDTLVRPGDWVLNPQQTHNHTKIFRQMLHSASAILFNAPSAAAPAFLPLRQAVARTVPAQPKLVHITQMKRQVTVMYRGAPFNNQFDKVTYKAFFDYLSNLPAEEADEHGTNSISAAVQVVLHAGISPGAFSTSCVSSIYPQASAPFNVFRSLTRSIYRFHMAFTSPSVLDLGPGDVLFISQSSGLLNGKTRPIIFDLSVYKITEWLEKRGVAVLFSAGGEENGSNEELNSPYLLLDNRPLPGILIGGVKADDASYDVTSHFGNLITCYSTPVTNPRRPDFGGASGATATAAGLVLRMQIHAKSQGRYLKPHEIREILKQTGRLVTISNNRQSSFFGKLLPAWNQVKVALIAWLAAHS